MSFFSNFAPITTPAGGFSPEGIGIRIAAILTIGIYSFLYKDNFLYKFAEYLFVGVSAGYLMVVSYTNYLLPSLITPLQTLSRDFYHIVTNSTAAISDPWMLTWQQELIKNQFGSQINFMSFFFLKVFFIYLIPAWLGLMMVVRLIPNAAWLSKFPLAIIVGYGSGITIVTSLQASVLEQIKACFVSFAPLFAGNMDFATIFLLVNNFILVAGICCSLIYFYFSAEHKGIFFGPASKLGIWVLMITFGASFGYTVMARISLLINRFQFLLGDWMHLIKS